jgi:hypothetical protein
MKESERRGEDEDWREGPGTGILRRNLVGCSLRGNITQILQPTSIRKKFDEYRWRFYCSGSEFPMIIFNF